MQEIFELLPYVPEGIEDILDVGFGKGQISTYFANKGKRVTGIGLEIQSYGIDIEQFEQKGIKIREADISDMPFADEEFDAVVLSHILEHVPNMQIALKEVRRVLKEGGWALIFLPHFSEYICAGHINTGWNLGQLMYVLLLNGFDINTGHFIEYGYSLCAYVQKKEFELPPLRGDRGDIHILNQHKLWPYDVKRINGIADGFRGDFMSLNWEGAETLINKKRAEEFDELSGKMKVFYAFVKILRKIVGENYCNAMGRLLIKDRRNINPTELA